jgi:hypothetical protein
MTRHWKPRRTIQFRNGEVALHVGITLRAERVLS